MNLKFLVLTIISLLFIQYGYSQTNKERREEKKENKIILKREIITQDSALATWPILVSVMEKNLLSNAKVKESFGEYSIKFYPEPDKGVIYIYFENLPKSINPELFFTNTKGDVIFKIRAKTRLNAINLRKIPAGKYLITADVNEEVTTWEVVKD